MSGFEALHGRVEQYYSSKVREFGATARGVDWNSAESQQLRFRELLRVRTGAGPFAINDYGCGYGALADALEKEGRDFSYSGFDLSEEMLGQARSVHEHLDDVRFVSDEAELGPADYTVASGVFNVKVGTDDEEWTGYAVGVIRRIWELSTIGCSFNLLTSYSDLDQQRDDLYYADPRFFFDLSKRELSRHVALLHDYGLWEFTMIVRREPA